MSLLALICSIRSAKKNNSSQIVLNDQYIHNKMEKDQFSAAKRQKREKILETKQKDADCSESIDSTECNIITIIKEIENRQAQITLKKYFEKFFDLFKTKTKGIEDIEDIVCYGLGTFKCKFSKEKSYYQMAFLLLLRNKLKPRPNLFLCDTDFDEKDLEVLKQLNCDVLKPDENGERKVKKNTIFYLPHCPPPLPDNILWANRAPENLSRIILIGGSLKNYIKDSFSNSGSPKMKYLYTLKASNAIEEWEISNTHPLISSAFYGFNISRFSSAKLQILGEDICQNAEELFN